MAKGKFLFGFTLGIAAGLAGKYLYDNRDAVTKVVNEKGVEIKDEINDFVEYAAKRTGDFGKEIAKYASYAAEQFQELKSELGEEVFESEDFDEPEAQANPV